MRFPFFIALLICALGIVALSRMPRDIDPPNIVHAETIVSYLPGTTPEKLDRMVTRPVERTLNAVPNIGDVGTQTTDGISIVTFQLTHKANREETLGIIRDRLDQLRSALQLEAPFLVGPGLQIDSGAVHSGLLLATETKPGKKPDFNKVRRATANLVEKFRADPAIASAEITHDQPRAVVIRYEDETLANAGLTPPELAEFIRANSQQFPGGYLASKNQLLAINIGRGISNVESLQNLPVRDPRDGSLTPLSDICEISIEPWDASLGGVFLDEQRALGITFTKTDSASWKSLSSAIEKLSQTEANITTNLFLYRGETTQKLIRSSSWTVFFSILVVLLCVTLGLGFRAGVAAAVAVVTTLLGTIFLLHLMGISLNVVTLAALAVGIGLLIDNHIVLTHHVSWLRSKNLPQKFDPRQRCWQDLATPLIIAAATTALGFLPAWLLRDEAAGYVSSLFVVIGTLLFVSQIVGFTITPALAPLSVKGNRLLNSWSEKFSALAMKRIQKPGALFIIILIAGILAALQIYFSDEKPMATIPTRHLSIDLKLPAGSTPERTASVAEKFRKILKTKFPQPVATFLNNAPPTIYRGSYSSLPAANRARLIVSSPPEKQLSESVLSLLTEKAPKGSTIEIRPISATPSNPQSVALRLHASSKVIAAHAKKGGDFSHMDEGVRISGVSITPNLEAAAEQKITTAEIALGALAATSGIPVSFLPDELASGDRHPVLLKVLSDDPDAEDRLAEAYVHRQTGGTPVPLEDVVTIEKRAVPVMISRWNGSNVGYLTLAASSAPIKAERSLLARLKKEATDFTRIEAIGESAQSNDAKENILLYLMPVSIGILLLLLIQTRSVRSVIAILLSMIPAIFGAGFLISLMTGFGVMPLLGLIALMGIVVNNAIVLVDRLRSENAQTDSEIIAVTRSRFLPILLSASCAILGLLPLLFSGNPLWIPFAAVMISGLFFGGFSVLVFLPALWKSLRG